MVIETLETPATFDVTHTSEQQILNMLPLKIISGSASVYTARYKADCEDSNVYLSWKSQSKGTPDAKYRASDFCSYIKRGYWSIIKPDSPITTELIW